MIDLNNVERYKENNRIEAKKALGGLPKSLWETYSAFANALGGVILLGVEEYKDKSFHVVDLPDPEGMVREFWEIANDPEMVSVNILSKADVFIQVADGKHFIVINVPRAGRLDKPVYVGGDPEYTYRRNGEGDYKCSREEYDAMVRDASRKSQDMRIINELTDDVFNISSVDSYRRMMEDLRPSHPWGKLSETDFLLETGALRNDNDLVHPTAAGLLMFGNSREIRKKFPEYLLKFRDEDEEIEFSSDDISWSGNIFDFYRRVCDELDDDYSDDVYEALHEAFINCLINADYRGRKGIVVIKKAGEIVFSNPGSFRIGIDDALNGGKSDSRNALLGRLFNIIDIGDGSGSGIPHIYSVWKNHGWKRPKFVENFDPDRISLIMSIEEDFADEWAGGSKNMVSIRDAVIDYLTEHISADVVEISENISSDAFDTHAVLEMLENEGIVTFEERFNERIYRLKA